MAVSGQIEIIEPDSGKKRYFSESELSGELTDTNDDLVVNPGSVVVLNPGDYTGVGNVGIPPEVTVVLMPGATVSYVSGFRTGNEFGTTGNPVNNSGHPLRSIDRYDAPNFTGATENIVDLNFGSEWAFEADLEDLRSTVQGEIVGGEFFWNIESGDLSSSPQTRFSSSVSVKSGAPPTRTLRFEDTEGTSFNVTEGDIDSDGTDEITIRAENEGVLSMSAGRLLQLGNGGADSGNILLFHKDVAIDSGGFEEAGQDIQDGVRLVSGLDINKSQPPTGGGGTFDGHVKRIDSIDLVGSGNIDITKNTQANSPAKYVISASISGGSTISVDDPENSRSFGDASTIVAGNALEATSPSSGEVRIDHEDTGKSFEFATENVVETTAEGHVQEAVTVGLSPSLKVDANAGSLEHDVNGANENTITGSFLETIEFDNNGHVTNVTFSTVDGGGPGGGSGGTISNIEFSQADSEFSITENSSTFNAEIVQRFLHDENSDKRLTGTNSAGSSNFVGVELDGTLTGPNDQFRIDGSFGTKYLSGATSITFHDSKSDMDSNTIDAKIEYRTGDDQFFISSIDNLELRSGSEMQVEASEKLTLKSITSNLDITALNNAVDISADDVTVDADKLKVIGDFEFENGLLKFKSVRTSQINISNTLDPGEAAIYLYDPLGVGNNIQLQWAERTPNGSTFTDVIGGTGSNSPI